MHCICNLCTLLHICDVSTDDELQAAIRDNVDESVQTLMIEKSSIPVDLSYLKNRTNLTALYVLNSRGICITDTKQCT